MALESGLLMVGDMQRLSFGGSTGEVVEDVYRGLVVGKDRLVGESAGDKERERQGGETGDVLVDVWFGLDVETDMTLELFWLAIGDWHLDPQGGEHGDVAAEV